MAEAFGIGAGVVSVIGLTIQISQIVVQFGLDWANAPKNVKEFKEELNILNAVLSQINSGILLNPEYAAASSSLLSQLGGPLSGTEPQSPLETCREALQALLDELKKKEKKQGHSWERLKGAFLAKHTRERVEDLHRRCQTLQDMIIVDAATIGVNTNKKIKEAIDQQQNYHREVTKDTSDIKKSVNELRQAGKELSSGMRDSIACLFEQQEELHRMQMNAISAIKDDMDGLVLREEHKAMLDWLTTIDYAPQQRRFINSRQPGTGQWLLDSTKFNAWVKTEKQTLFCPGVPGAGKTILTSVVVNYLQADWQNNAEQSIGDPNDKIGVAFVYCDFQQRHQQRPIDILASLIKQLIQDRPFVPKSVKDLYKIHKNTPSSSRSGSEIRDFSDTLRSVVSDFTRIFIVFDALDEYEYGHRSELISQISELQAQTKANVFATSRPIPHIQKEFEDTFRGSMSLDMSARDEDVKKYLDSHMSELPLLEEKNTDLKEEAKVEIKTKIKANVVKTANGVFLLAKFHLDSLVDKTTRTAMICALEALPKGKDALAQSYGKTITRIRSQKPGFRLLAENVLSFLTCAERLLSPLELRHALAVKVDTSTINENDLESTRIMVSVCAGLVVVDEERNIIRLLHPTTREYLETHMNCIKPQKDLTTPEDATIQEDPMTFNSQKNADAMADAQKNFTITCVTYLLFDAFETGFCPTDEAFEQRVRSNPLYRYAARNWAHYSRKAPTLDRKVIDFLESKARVEASCQVMMAAKRYLRHSNYSQLVPSRMTGLHLAAYFGLVEALKDLSRRHDLEAKCSHGRTPLSYAAERGNEDAVKFLLETKKVEADSKGENGQTPLSYAAGRGHAAVVNLLLATNDVDPNSQAEGYSNMTPLLLAAEKGHEVVVKLLLNNIDVDPDMKNIIGWTPLSLAAVRGQEEVIKLLLARDEVKVDSRAHIFQRTPLSWAAERGYDSIVKLLLQTPGVAADSRDDEGRTPLSYAAERGYTSVVELLLTMATIDINMKDDRGRTPLSYAVEKGHEAVVKQLLAIGKVDVDAK